MVHRISDWNGGDLETPERVQLTKAMVKRHRPVHLWISCECGPYSPLQRINRRNPEQIQRLDEKQAKARKQHQGAIQVADFATALGTQVHWELSERCGAWHLPEIESFVQRHQLQKVTCSGCAVGLRTIDRQKLLKQWPRNILSFFNVYTFSANETIPKENVKQGNQHIQRATRTCLHGGW